MQYYLKNPPGIWYNLKAFDGKTLSLSAMGIYGLFLVHPVLKISDILEFTKESLEEIQEVLNELIKKNFLEEVPNE